MWQSCAVNPQKVPATVLAFTLCLALTGCSGGSTKTLTWWSLPDRVGADSLARRCSDIADGYRVEVRTLSPLLADRRADVIRRLSADDHGVDILSLDSALTAEFAAAGYLRALPADLRSQAGLLPRAVSAASYKGTLVAVPWWVDPQLLWFRGAAAESAGVDTTKSISWDALLAGANRVRASVQFDDPDGTGMSDWVRGLLAESGGVVLRGTSRKPQVGLAGDAGRVAAGIVQFYAGSGLGSGPSAQAFGEFAGSHGAFLVARSSAKTAPALASVASDMRALPYPVIGGRSVSPLAGAALAVPTASDAPKAAFAAVRCLTSESAETEAMRNSGRGAARTSVYTRTPVTKAVPHADVLLKAARTGVNVPSTPHWHLAEAGLRMTWTPLSSVKPAVTPKQSQQAVTDLVAGGLR